MDRKNIQSTIDILKRAQNFNITDFQQRADVSAEFELAYTEAELHACGNSACIAGHVAVSPEWKAFGGLVSDGIGIPYTEFSESPAGAMALYWGLSIDMAEAIVFGSMYTRFVYCHDLIGMPDIWHEMTKDAAISIFEQLLMCDDESIAQADFLYA
jgi:hypothetical protein